MKKNNPKTIKAWAMYDWANSVYSLVITSAIFPVFYSEIMTDKAGNSISVLGLKPESAINLSLAISFGIVIFLSPILSSIADTIGNKMKFLKIFCYTGAISCIMLFFFFNENWVILGLFFNISASVGFWGSLVFYNSYLPDIASDENMDKVSAKGFITGYIGSVILLTTCLALIMFLPKMLASNTNEVGKITNLITRVCFLLTGIWWVGFAQITFKTLPSFAIKKKIPNKIVKNSFQELQKVMKQVFAIPNLKIFLGSFFFYSFGMQTIFLMAAVFGEKEIGLPTEKLILTILLIQIEAILGAWIFSKLSNKIGNRNTILVGIFVWIIVCYLGYIIQKQEWLFYTIAALVGLVMGGIQALSRSTYGKLLPKTQDNTIFFSFYDIFEKLALFCGLITFFMFTQFGEGMKQAVLAMGFSFLISFIIMLFLKKKQLISNNEI